MHQIILANTNGEVIMTMNTPFIPRAGEVISVQGIGKLKVMLVTYAAGTNLTVSAVLLTVTSAN